MRAYFEYKVSQGKTKIQALLCIIRRLVRIVYAMMKYKTVYKASQIPTKYAENVNNLQLRGANLEDKMGDIRTNANCFIS